MTVLRCGRISRILGLMTLPQQFQVNICQTNAEPRYPQRDCHPPMRYDPSGF